MPAGSADVSSELLRSQRAGTNSILRARGFLRGRETQPSQAQQHRLERISDFVRRQRDAASVSGEYVLEMELQQALERALLMLPRVPTVVLERAQRRRLKV